MTQELTCQIREAGQSTLVDLAGRLDHATVSQFRKAIRSCIDHQSREVVVDCGKLDYLDSLAMGGLLACRDLLTKEGKTLVLANCRGLLLDALRLGNFHKIFEMR